MSRFQPIYMYTIHVNPIFDVFLKKKPIHISFLLCCPNNGHFFGGYIVKHFLDEYEIWKYDDYNISNFIFFLKNTLIITFTLNII